jgi:hypothetical protein
VWHRFFPKCGPCKERGSQQFLKNRRDTLRIFLYALREDKLRRILGRGKSESEAQQCVDTVLAAGVIFVGSLVKSQFPSQHFLLNFYGV